MTEPAGGSEDREDQRPEVDADLIKDLEVVEDADRVRGGLHPCGRFSSPSVGG